MKKTLVVLLALVMVLAFAATALADNPGVGDEQIASYTDLADTKDEWASAIYKLTALGVLQGDHVVAHPGICRGAVEIPLGVSGLDAVQEI